MSKEDAKESLDGEEFYDKEIAPLLMEVAQICKKKDISFFSSVEYLPSDFGITMHYVPGRHIIFDFYNALRQCTTGVNAINMDKFLFGIMKWAREMGHSSILLNKLGVGMPKLKRGSALNDKI